MKIKAYTTPKLKKETVYLRLIDEGDSVELRVVNDQGKPVARGVLLKFYHYGTVMRYRGINPLFGFLLNDEGRLIIE